MHDAADGKAAIGKEVDEIRIELSKSSAAIATEIVGRVLGRGVS